MLTPSDLRRPLLSGWRMYVGVDTGTYMSATFGLFPPDSFDVFIVEEFPNYRYVGGEIELLGESIPEWARRVKKAYDKYIPGRSRLKGICDENSQFKTELRHYGINLRGNPHKLELRVEITREYFNNRRIFLAPWLSVLPYELEHAVWPDDTNSAGRFERLKEKDHTLDTIEHICSQRPKNIQVQLRPKKSFTEQQFDLHKAWRKFHQRGVDPNLGAL